LLVSRSHLFLTVKCNGCQYKWAIGLAGLSNPCWRKCRPSFWRARFRLTT